MATWWAAVALDEALIALQQAHDDGMCRLEAEMTDATLPRGGV